MTIPSETFHRPYNGGNAPMNLRELLDGMPFPVEKIEIISYAEDHDASEEALEALRALPRMHYNGPHTLNHDLGLIARTAGSMNLWSSAGTKDEAP
jgi:hypothetical protein